MTYKYKHALTDKIFEKAKKLEQFPQMGRVVPEIGRSEIRELIFRNYRIIYHLITKTQVNILAVHNGLRPLTEESLFE